MEIKSTILKMKKRDGRIVPFDPDRIVIAISKALKAAGTGNDKVSRHVAQDVVRELEAKGYDSPDMLPDVEVIQDLVEHALVKRGLAQAAKLYILYRANHQKMREARKLMMDRARIWWPVISVRRTGGSTKTPIPATPTPVCSIMSPDR